MEFVEGMKFRRVKNCIGEQLNIRMTVKEVKLDKNLVVFMCRKVPINANDKVHNSELHYETQLGIDYLEDRIERGYIKRISR